MASEVPGNAFEGGRRFSAGVGGGVGGLGRSLLSKARFASATAQPDLMAYGQFRRPLGGEEGGGCSQTEALARRRKAATRSEAQS